MSRYKFEKLLKNENIDDLRGTIDIFSFSIQDWQERGYFGYDRPLSTYFLQLDSIRGDEPDIWYGAAYGEIKSPYILIAILKNIFNKDFNYNAELIDFIIKDRDKNYQDSIAIAALKYTDVSWKYNTFICPYYVQHGLYQKID
ncbi:MAG: hypothetical protein ACYDDE_03955 [bacterium]